MLGETFFHQTELDVAENDWSWLHDLTLYFDHHVSVRKLLRFPTRNKKGTFHRLKHERVIWAQQKDRDISFGNTVK